MKHDYHGKPASLSARLMRVARRYKKEEKQEKAAELAALPKRELGENEKKRLPEFIAPGDVTCFCVDDKNVLWIARMRDFGAWTRAKKMNSTACSASEPTPVCLITASKPLNRTAKTACGC